MAKIRRLPKDIAEKIAAGEVVERPASVVKELLENSIDAGAGRIVIDLEEGGTRLIAVADDGQGILAEDLPVAFERHTTSKLATLDDLYAVRTLGFRGEALASVGAVSRVEITSAVAGEPSGARLEVVGGRIGEVVPEGRPVGTAIVVRDLFFNTPARKKFLKKEPTELGHITSVVQNIALAFPQVHIELTHNRRSIFTLPATSDVRERVAQFFGNELARDLISVAHDDGMISLDALLAPRHHTRANSRGQFIFVNHRCVRDSLLQGAVNQAYRGFIESGRYPVAFLFLEIDPAEVDVNVHPAKLEIRFRSSSQIYSSVLAALRTELEKAWPRIEVGLDEGSLDERRERIKQKIGDFFLHAQSPQQRGLWSPSSGPGSVSQAPGAPLLPVHGVMQLHNSYLIEETDEGFRISDQHALHERVLFEEVKTKLSETGVNSQQLLTPQVMSVTEQDVLAIEEHGELFRKMGLDVTPAGPRTLAVNAIPEVLPMEEIIAFLRDALDRLEEEREGKTEDDRLADLASVLACRAAVKAGEPLSPQEMENILNRAEKTKANQTCPHGRPTTLYFTLNELERRFGRK